MATATRPLLAPPPRPRGRTSAPHDAAAVAGAVLCFAVLLTALLVLAAFTADLAAGALAETTARLVSATSR